MSLDPDKTKPLGNAVLVKILGNVYDTNFRNSPIIIPDQKHEHPHRIAEVIKTGPGKVSKRGNRIPVSVVPGDYVVCTGYSGTDGRREGKEAGDYQLITEDDIVLVIDEDIAMRCIGK